MTHQESQELKTYLEQRFDGVDQRFDKVDERLDKVDERLDKIDVHLDHQDAELNKTTMNLLLTIEDARKDARRYAARLFGILDRPALDTEGAPKAIKPRRPRLPRAPSGR